MNIHPRAACGICASVYAGIIVLISKIFNVDFIDSPELMITILIMGVFLCHFIDRYFRKRYKNPRDESIYYDDTFQDNPFEEKEIDKRRE